MSPASHKHDPALRRRLYVVHLLSMFDHGCDTCRYVARIHLWASRSNRPPIICEREFADECELIETINPFLPPGSDVRDVFGQIESPSGFLYLLRLSSTEARQFGWRCESPHGIHRRGSIDINRD